MTEKELLLYDRLEVIRKTIERYGEDNFYLSFSGGKDSTVLHFMLDEALPNSIPRVFMNTGIEYAHTVEHVRNLAESDKRILILNSKVNIKRMLETEGYPFKSKFHADMVNRYQKKGHSKTTLQYFKGIKANGEHASAKFVCPEKLKYQFSKEFQLKLSAQCCTKLKKEPLHEYEHESNRHVAIIGTRREEGGIRSIHEGCILTDSKGNLIKFKPLTPVNDEFMDWYIETRNIELSKLYYPPFNFIRTGCKGCPFALNLEKELKTMEEYLPNERKQCEFIWKPVYEEYRKLNYRLHRIEQNKLF